jgi:hypothetical protein
MDGIIKALTCKVRLSGLQYPWDDAILTGQILK